VSRSIQITEFSTEHESQVRRLVLDTLGEFGFSFDLALDSDLGRIHDVYCGRGRFWVAVDGDVLVGTVGLRERDMETAELRRMYLAPSHRGHGIGLALLRHAVQFARQQRYRLIQLDTTPSMKQAIRLYEHYGFRKVAIREHHIEYEFALFGVIRD
jgi:ribosomal protein S18 acetylase RimI-like enzyme